MENLNFDAFKAVETRNPRSGGASSSYDFRYSTKREKFMIGTEFWEKNNLDSQGMTVFNAPGQPVLIGIADEERSQFLTRRKKATSKTKEFTHRTLRSLLDDRGVTTIDVSLEKVGEHDGYTMFKLNPVPESGDVYDSQEDDQEDSADSIADSDSVEEDFDADSETEQEESFVI